jgi:hypothetical protein
MNAAGVGAGDDVFSVDDFSKRNDTIGYQFQDARRVSR